MFLPDMSAGIKRKWFPLNQEMVLQAHMPPDHAETKRLEHTYLKQIANGTVYGIIPRLEPDEDPVEAIVLPAVLEKPPLPGQIGTGRVNIKLLEEIVPPKCGRQRLFLARVTAASAHLSDFNKIDIGTDLVAEAFDPLYMEPSNYSLDADIFYSSAVQAYEFLKPLQGKEIPRFYGSYTARLPVEGHPKHKYREVRIILREYIHGTGLSKIWDPMSLSRQQRERLMEHLIETEQAIEDNNVGITKRFNSSTVILRDKVDMRIVVWNFNRAVYSPDFDHYVRGDKNFAPGKQGDPLLKWSDDNLPYDFECFVDWPWIDWVRKKYGDSSCQKWDHSEEMKE